MSDESAKTPSVPSVDSSDDIEKLSAEAALTLARAKLSEADAKLTKAKAPLIDRLIMRGLIPVALALVGPWAIYKFSTESQETREAVVAQAQQLDAQKEVVGDLKKLLNDAVSYRDTTAKTDAEWRERMRSLEERKAAEITALSAVVVRLEQALKMTMLRLAMESVINANGFGGGVDHGAKSGAELLRGSRREIVEQSMRQVQWPSSDPVETRVMAEEIFEKIIQERQKK